MQRYINSYLKKCLVGQFLLLPTFALKKHILKHRKIRSACVAYHLTYLRSLAADFP